MMLVLPQATLQLHLMLVLPTQLQLVTLFRSQVLMHLLMLLHLQILLDMKVLNTKLLQFLRMSTQFVVRMIQIVEDWLLLLHMTVLSAGVGGSMTFLLVLQALLIGQLQMVVVLMMKCTLLFMTKLVISVVQTMMLLHSVVIQF